MDFWDFSTTFFDDFFDISPTFDGNDDNKRTVQDICPSFEARTPYLVMLISSTVSIWLAAIIFLWNDRDCNLNRCRKRGENIDNFVEVIEISPNNVDRQYFELNDMTGKVSVTEQSKFKLQKWKLFKMVISSLLIIYTITGFWYNLILDFMTLQLDGNDGKWICYITIFASSPNFKHMISASILSVLNYQSYKRAMDRQNKFKICKFWTSMMLVLIPGFIFYTLPLIYVIIAMLVISCLIGVACIRLVIDAGTTDCRLCESVYFDGCLIMLLMLLGSVCVLSLIFLGDWSVCIIHKIDGCSYWRLSFDEYLKLMVSDIQVMIRFITFFTIQMFH